MEHFSENFREYSLYRRCSPVKQNRSYSSSSSSSILVLAESTL